MALTGVKMVITRLLFIKWQRNVRKVSQIMAMAFLNHKPNGFKNVVDQLTQLRCFRQLQTWKCSKTKRSYQICVTWTSIRMQAQIELMLNQFI